MIKKKNMIHGFFGPNNVLTLTLHCAKSVRLRNFSGLYFPAFGLNTERQGASLRIHSECGEIRTRKAPNTDIFQAVFIS